MVPPPVTSITVTEYLVPTGKLTVAWNWTAPSGVSESVYFNVLYQKDHEPVVMINNLTTESFDILAPISGTYGITITAVDTVSNLPSKYNSVQYNYRSPSLNSPLLPPTTVNYAGA